MAGQPGIPVVLDDTPDELVVLKPAGLACELPFDEEADTLVSRLAAEGYQDLRLVHRLDAPASGLMLIARSAQAAAFFAAEIEARRWHKWYVARVALPDRKAGRLLGAHKAYLKTEGRVARVVRSGGKPSFLDVVRVTPVPGHQGEGDVLIRLHTGRFHQIRAMLAHLGAPLVGDARYGGPEHRPMYLEHVVLAARSRGASGWTVWAAPPHPDRPEWDAGMTGAVAGQAGAMAAELSAIRRGWLPAST